MAGGAQGLGGGRGRRAGPQADDDGAPDASLSDRLKALRMKEASEASPEALERAAANKQTLSERLKDIMASEWPALAQAGQGGQEGAGVLDAGTAADGSPPALGMPGAAPGPGGPAASALEPPEPAHPTPSVPRPPDPAAMVAGIDALLLRSPQAAQVDRSPEAGLALLRRLQEEQDVLLRMAPKSADVRRSALAWFLGRSQQDPGAGILTRLPRADPARWIERDFYELEPPYSYVRILQDRGSGEYLYEAIEPELSVTERQVLEFVQDALVRGLNVDPSMMKPEDRTEYLLRAVREIIADYRIRVDATEQARIEYYIRRDFLGLGPIHPVMVDPNIEDVSCDGAAHGLFVFHRQYESIPSTIRFRSDAELDAFVIRLAQRSGKAISISDPILDAALPDGSRLQATLGREVTQNGSTFTIRRFKPDPFTPVDLVRFGTMSVDLLAWFWLIVQYGYSLIFSGGTASGKTTGLNAICQFIPQTAKVVSIEDTREVNLPHANWIKAVTRTGSTVEGTGEIGMFELLKASLRQRPEYIIVGEVRGMEATVAFQAMATGHTVYSTMHADSARSVVYRLENDPINIPRLVLQALDVIAIQAQTRVNGRRVRRIMEVVELVGMDPATKELLTNTTFRWDPGTDSFTYSGRSYMLERIAEERNWTKAQGLQEFERRKRIIRRMLERNVRDVRELTDLVKAYYRDPEALEAALEAAAR